MSPRKGISFTLTLVVVGVVLMMTSVTIIVLGGGFLGGWGQQVDETTLGVAVGQSCSVVGQNIDRQYCNMYVYTGEDVPDGEDADCERVRSGQSTDYAMTAQQAGCNWAEYGGDRLDDILREPPAGIDHDHDRSAVIRLQGNDYDCVDGGAMSTTCPAGDTSPWQGSGADQTVAVSGPADELDDVEFDDDNGAQDAEPDDEEDDEEIQAGFACPRTDDGICEDLDLGAGPGVGCPIC